MNRLLIALPLMLLPATAMAQAAIPDEVHKQLWCGTAFVVFFTPPADATDAEKAEVKVFLDDAAGVLASAGATLKGLGYDDAAIAKIDADLVQLVTQQMTDDKTEFTKDECTPYMQSLANLPLDNAPTDGSSAPPQ